MEPKWQNIYNVEQIVVVIQNKIVTEIIIKHHYLKVNNQ